MPTFWRSATDASWSERLHMHGEAGAGDVPTAAVAQLKYSLGPIFSPRINSPPEETTLPAIEYGHIAGN